MVNRVTYLNEINEALEAYLPTDDGIVSQAMRYSIKNGGKRIRPELVLQFCRASACDYKKAMPFACAIEMIHTYSLIHDDLPCMDDDDFRRGQPSCHIKFGEEYALLAGDALLTLAFETALSADLPLGRVVNAAKVLAEASGIRGMIGGQVLDLENEGKNACLEAIEKTDKLKTGELVRASCVMGCIAAGASDEKIKAAEKYAASVGLAFQIVDDILDVTSQSNVLGKPVGSDKENEKSTYVSLLGVEKSKNLAKELTQSAKKSLEAFDGDTCALKDFADSLQNRKN